MGMSKYRYAIDNSVREIKFHIWDRTRELQLPEEPDEHLYYTGRRILRPTVVGDEADNS